jgi:uncharacterized protein YbcV (DUF1398 family)
MQAEQIATAQSCLDGAYADALSFPESVRLLLEAGFEGYCVDYRRHTRTHYLPDGESLVLETPCEQTPVSETFDRDIIAASIKWAQSGAPGYTYAAFNKRVIAAGCAGYFVSFLGQRVVYYGRTGELHIEHFPR